MSDYIFELALSSTMARIGELTQARGRALNLALNRAGSFQMTLPLDDDISEEVQEVSTCVIIRRLGSIVWSGPVWTVEETTPNSLSVGCVGWLQTLEKRISKYAWGNPLVYSATDAGIIALDLLTRSNADNVTGPNYVTPGTITATQLRNKQYSPFSKVLDEIIALSDLESGYDMAVDPASRKLHIYSTLPLTTDTTYFEYGGNAKQVSRSSDSARIANRIIAYSPVGWAQADDVVSQASMGVFEEAISLSDVRDSAILTAFANAELAVRSTPLRFSSFEPRSGPSAPRIFKDFEIGGYSYITADRGRLFITNQLARLFSATVTWPDDGQGTEQISSIQTIVG